MCLDTVQLFIIFNVWFLGEPVEVAISMFVISVSAISEVNMVRSYGLCSIISEIIFKKSEIIKKK